MQTCCRSHMQLIVSTVIVVLQQTQSMSMLCYALLCCALPRGQLLHTAAKPESCYQLVCLSAQHSLEWVVLDRGELYWVTGSDTHELNSGQVYDIGQ